MKLSGKTVLVTGASRGIGKAVARRLAAAGGRIALHYHSDRSVAEAALASLGEGHHACFQADIGQSESVRKLVEQVLEQFERIDVLVNNAGIFLNHPIREVDYGTWLKCWQETMSTNLFGAANVSFWVIKQMLSIGGGRIINVSSRGAFRGEPDAPAYGASKAGMNAMSQSLAKALAPENIFVFALAPGFVSTERILMKMTPVMEADIKSQSPLGRMTTPEEVAEAILFLATDAPAAMSGAIIDVNGASYLRT
ncbi:MAG: SDR family oxidoreductase [bacterium]